LERKLREDRRRDQTLFVIKYSLIGGRVVRNMAEEDEPIKKILKKIYKDIEPVKDIVSEVTEEVPETLEKMKRKLSKKFKEE
jgi:hypothetical protein